MIAFMLGGIAALLSYLGLDSYRTSRKPLTASDCVEITGRISEWEQITFIGGADSGPDYHLVLRIAGHPQQFEFFGDTIWMAKQEPVGSVVTLLVAQRDFTAGNPHLTVLAFKSTKSGYFSLDYTNAYFESNGRSSLRDAVVIPFLAAGMIYLLYTVP